MLVACGLVLACLAAAYGLTSNWLVPLVLAAFHGVFWSGLLSASAAYMTDLIPETRRAEGIGYWGLSTIAALAMTLFLCSFGYGGITSFAALYTDALGVTPRGIYFTALATSVVIVRPFSGAVADRIGHLRVLLPSLLLTFVGLALLPLSAGRASLVFSALVFGAGFGSSYPVFAAYVMRRIEARRRGAAFGSILAAFDTGIGTGSIATGILVQRLGFRAAFGVGAGLAMLAPAYFLWADARDRAMSERPSTSGA